jgi:hypothetical protein
MDVYVCISVNGKPRKIKVNGRPVEVEGTRFHFAITPYCWGQASDNEVAFAENIFRFTNIETGMSMGCSFFQCDEKKEIRELCKLVKKMGDDAIGRIIDGVGPIDGVPELKARGQP